MRTIVNRSPVDLSVTFDGQTTVLPASSETALPLVAVNYAKNQNPIMGSADPNNPSMSGARYLIGVKGQDECAPLTSAEWKAHCEAACRMDWHDLVEDRLKPGEKVIVKGKKGGTQAKNAYDSGVRVRGSELNPVSDTV